MGGPAGEIDFPVIVKESYAEILIGTVGDLENPTIPNISNAAEGVLGEINTVLATNPFTTALAYPPDTDLSALLVAIDEFQFEIRGIDEVSIWSRLTDEIIPRLDEIAPSAEDDDAEAVAFERQSQNNLARSYNRVTAGFMDINAVSSTAFPTALAIMEASFNTDVARFNAERRISRSRERALVYLQSLEVMAGLLQARYGFEVTALQARENYTKFKIGIKTDQFTQDLTYNIQSITWKADSLQRGMAAVGGLNGVPILPEKLTPFQRVVSSLGEAAALGLSIGSATGRPGIGIAAFLGAGILGGIASLQ